MSDTLADEITALKQAVTGQNSVIAGATTLLDGLSKQLVEALASAQTAGATGEQLAALHDVVNTVTLNTTALASAVQANTPAAQPLPSDNVTAVAQQAANTIGTAQAVVAAGAATDPATAPVPVSAPASDAQPAAPQAPVPPTPDPAAAPTPAPASDVPAAAAPTPVPVTPDPAAASSPVGDAAAAVPQASVPVTSIAPPQTNLTGPT